jgi:hypothetical protein
VLAAANAVCDAFKRGTRLGSGLVLIEAASPTILPPEPDWTVVAVTIDWLVLAED